MKKFLNNTRDINLIFLIILFVFLIRSPFFFLDYLDSDEATFILKGLAIAKGKIPYIDFQNYKPPISAYFLSAIIYFVDNSLLVIRFFTALLICLSSFFLYRISRLYNFSKYNSFLTSLIFIVCVSFITRSEKSQSFYSEHISIMLILFSIYLFLKFLEKKNDLSFFFQGLILGIATLNTPYLGFFSLLYVFYPFYFVKERLVKKFIYSFSIVMGGLFTLLIFLLYFYPIFPSIISYTFFSGISEILYTPYETIYYLIGAGLQIGNIKFFSAIFIWSIGFFGFIHILYYKNFQKKYLILLLNLIILSISIILIHYPSGRYLIIVAPFYSILLIYFLNLKFFKNFKIIKYLILICIFLFPLFELQKKILILKKVNLNKNTLTYGRCTSLLNEIEKKELLGKKIYFQDCHIIKFFINKLPLLDIYHPNDIFYEERMSAFGKKYLGDELFKQNPEILVLQSNLKDFITKLRFQRIKPKDVLNRYDFLLKKSNLFIYQVKN